MPAGPLQNRVFPDGLIVATPHRGTMYGNRGGRIHDPVTRQFHPNKRWASRQWICCVLQFKDQQRPLMGLGYTEMFFSMKSQHLPPDITPVLNVSARTPCALPMSGAMTEPAKPRRKWTVCCTVNG